MNNILIKLKEECKNWEEVVFKGVGLLEENGFVNEIYKKKIIENFYEFGPYMVIAPQIVLLHARQEDGVIKTGLSILTLKNPINFGSELNDPVKLVFSFCSIDNKDHMVLLSNLMKLLMSKEDLENLMNEDNIENVKKIIEKFDL